MSVISFTSSVHSLNNEGSSRGRREDIDMKIECVDSLVALLGCTDIDKMSRTFLAMSSTPANCDLMRSHRVIPLLVQLLHDDGKYHPQEIRRRVGRALHNIVHAHPEHKQCKREAKVLRLLEVLRMYADFLRDLKKAGDVGGFKCGCGGPLRVGVAHGDEGDVLVCGKFSVLVGLRGQVSWQVTYGQCMALGIA